MAALFRTRQPFLQLNAWQNQALNALHYNTSQQGSVIPLIYGTTRQQVNLIDFGNYQGPAGSKGKTGSIPVTGTNTRVGKGGGKSSKKSTPDYTVDAMFAIAQGPVTFNPNNLVFSSAGISTIGSLPLNFYVGADGQAGDPTFIGLGDTVNYSGTNVISATPLDLGPSPVLPNISVETTGFLAGVHSGPIFPLDANPADVITDFLTNARYGAGFPSANLDNLIGGSGTAYGDYCQAAQLLISVSLDGHQKAIEWLDAIAKLTNTAMFFSGKLLKFIPYGDLALNSNSATWTPNLNAAYEINDDGFLPWREHKEGEAEIHPGEDDPVLVTRTNPADADNWFAMEYTDRTNYYNVTTLTAFDQGTIDAYGLRTGDTVPGRAFCQVISAQVSLQLAVQRKVYIRNTPYKIYLGWQYALVEPMDILNLTGRYGDLYLQHQPVRVLSVEEDERGGLTIEAEEIQTGVPAPVIPPICLPNPLVTGGNWDPGNTGPNIVLSNANLTATTPNLYPSLAWSSSRTNIGHTSSTLRYFETTMHGFGVDFGNIIGISNSSLPLGAYCGSDANGVGFHADFTFYNGNIISPSTGTNLLYPQFIGIAMGHGKLWFIDSYYSTSTTTHWFGDGNTSLGSNDPGLNIGGYVIPSSITGTLFATYSGFGDPPGGDTRTFNGGTSCFYFQSAYQLLAQNGYLPWNHT